MKSVLFYRLMVMLTLAAYAWVGICFFSNGKPFNGSEIHPCLVKSSTGIPCPSCGMTRSVLMILNADFSEAFMLNPLGYLAVLLLLVLPLILFHDALRKTTLLFSLYRKGELMIQNKKSAVVLVLLFLALWGWNIHKGL